jgi:NifU-like protein involved in Fe-S cluster formation
MDETIVKYYRRLLKEDFPHAGEIKLPTIFVEAIGERMIHCGNTGNYMQLYLQVADGRITDIQYLCACEPVANVAVEVLCTLVKGKTLDEATGLTEEAFYQFLGCEDEELRKKARGLLELLNEGIARYHTLTGAKGLVAKDGDGQGGKLNWDGALSI